MLKSKTNIPLFIFSTPVIYFLLCRLTGFMHDAWSVALPEKFIYIGTTIGAVVVLVFAKHISAYLLQFKNNTVFSAIVYILSAIFTIVCRGIITADCATGQNILNLTGAWLLLGTMANIIISNICYVFTGAKKIRLVKGDILFLVAVFLVLNIQGFLYCRFMKQIFIWDNAGYFTTVHMLDEIFPSAEYFRQVYRSVFTTDYNYIIAIPANIMCAIFGKSRLVFVLSIINFYLFPIFVLIYIFEKKFFTIGKTKTLCIFFLLPYMIFAADTGFVDIGCVLPALAVVILYLYCDRNKTTWLCGILLALCILMRRWYSFFSLSFVITSLIHGILTKKSKSALELAFGCAFGLLFFAQSFVSGKLLADYGNMYSAYALGLKYDILLFTRYYGIILPVSIIIFAICKSLTSAGRRKKCPETFCLVQLVICFTMFVSVQTHGQQHLALYIPIFIPLILSIASYVRKKHIALPLAIICILHTANTFVPRIQPAAIKEIRHPAILPNYSSYPPRNVNVDNIPLITEYMDREIGLKNSTVCLLSSSLDLNYDTLKNAEISLSLKQKYPVERGSYYLPIAEIDNRDGLAHTLFDADYVLIPSSLQIHLAEDEQQVISIPYRYITEGTGFGTAYEKDDISFKVNDDTQLYVYRRTRDISSEERQNVNNLIFN